MSETGDIRVDEMMPDLCDSWPALPFENCLLPAPSILKKLKSSEIASAGAIPVIDQGENFISGYTNDQGSKYPGPVPVVIFGDHTRRFKYVDFSFAVGADGTRMLYPIRELDPKFFYHYLSALNLEAQGYSRHYKFLKEAFVPLPPLPEQHRIVVKLEVLLGKVDACRKRLEKIPVILKRFRQSVLAAACSGRLTADWREESADQEWQETNLGEIAAAFRTGPFGSALHKSDYIKNGIPVINPTNLVDGRIVPSDQVTISQKTFAQLSEYSLRKGDIVIARRGEMGRCAIVTAGEEGWLCGTGSAILRTGRSATPLFLQLVISSPEVRAYLSESSVGSTMDNLNQTLFKAMPLSLPPLPEQHEIVRRVEALFALADKIETRYTKAKTHVDRLTQSILAKAFRGNLVPQDPNDEPATMLLESIRSQRQEAGVARGQPRRKGVTAAGTAGIR